MRNATLPSVVIRAISLAGIVILCGAGENAGEYKQLNGVVKALSNPALNEFRPVAGAEVQLYILSDGATTGETATTSAETPHPTPIPTEEPTPAPTHTPHPTAT